MKTLLITRHAKSSWDNRALSDFDRPLNERGLNDAPKMGKFLKEKNLTPDLILSSQARRAKETAGLIAEHSGYGKTIKFIEGLYNGDASVYLDTLKDEAAGETVMIIGHNPDVEVLLKKLTGQSEKMSTANIAEITFKVTDWKELASGQKGELKKIWRPKEI